MGILHRPGPVSLLKVQVSMDSGAGSKSLTLVFIQRGKVSSHVTRVLPRVGILQLKVAGHSGMTALEYHSLPHSLGPSLTFLSPGDSKLTSLPSPDAQPQSRTLAVDAGDCLLTLFLTLAARPALLCPLAGDIGNTWAMQATCLIPLFNALLPFTGRDMPAEGAIETKPSCRAL